MATSIPLKSLTIHGWLERIFIIVWHIDILYWNTMKHYFKQNGSAFCSQDNWCVHVIVLMQLEILINYYFSRFHIKIESPIISMTKVHITLVYRDSFHLQLIFNFLTYTGKQILPNFCLLNSVFKFKKCFA